MKSLFIALFCFPLLVFGQGKPTDLFSLKFGYGSTNLRIKEATVSPNIFFGSFFGDGKTFVGEGVHFGFTKDLDDHLFIELSTALFSGGEVTFTSGNYLSSVERRYTFKGVRIPVSVNYLFRDPSKRLRVGLGGGFQYLHFKFQQFQTQSASGSTTTSIVTDLNKGMVQLVLSPGIQYRIIEELRATFNVQVGLISRYTDAPTFSLKYTFRNKNL